MKKNISLKLSIIFSSKQKRNKSLFLKHHMLIKSYYNKISKQIKKEMKAKNLQKRER